MGQIYSNRRDTKVFVGTAERVVSEMATTELDDLEPNVPNEKVPQPTTSEASNPALVELNTDNPEPQTTDTNNPEAHALTDKYHPWFEALYTTHRATLIAQASTILFNSRLDGVAAEDMMHQVFVLAWIKRGELIEYDMPIV